MVLRRSEIPSASEWQLGVMQREVRGTEYEVRRTKDEGRRTTDEAGAALPGRIAAAQLQMRTTRRMPDAQEVGALVHRHRQEPANLLDEGSFTLFF
jgi:hypothetical protein